MMSLFNIKLISTQVPTEDNHQFVEAANLKLGADYDAQPNIEKSNFSVPINHQFISNLYHDNMYRIKKAYQIKCIRIIDKQKDRGVMLEAFLLHIHHYQVPVALCTQGHKDQFHCINFKFKISENIIQKFSELLLCMLL